MNAYKNMREFAKGYSIPGANIEATFKAYTEIAEKQTRDPEVAHTRPMVAASLETHEVLLE